VKLTKIQWVGITAFSLCAVLTIATNILREQSKDKERKRFIPTNIGTNVKLDIRTGQKCFAKANLWDDGSDAVSKSIMQLSDSVSADWHLQGYGTNPKVTTSVDSPRTTALRQEVEEAQRRHDYLVAHPNEQEPHRGEYPYCVELEGRLLPRRDVPQKFAGTD
jgi:hypothetical protein